jgi:hypothetical protein
MSISFPILRNLVAGMCFGLLSTASLTALAQTCPGPERYLDPVFTGARTASNLSYGNAPALAGLCLSEWWTSSENLKLDVYEPLGDTLERRPCLVYAHGGAFAIGDKRMAPVEDYCLEMAARGYVVLSLDYRKCFNALSYSSTVRAVYRAVQDMSAAVRFARENADAFGIDTNQVFAGGNSAGGFMALHAAYAEEDERASALGPTYDWPNLGCLTCSGNSFDRSGRPDAVINLWGAIFDTAWIEPGDAPLYSVHGGIDGIVLPGYWPPFSWPVFPAVYGSLPIHERTANLGIASELLFLPLEGHEPWLLSLLAPVWFDEITRSSARFLWRERLRPNTAAPVGPSSVCAGATASYSVPNTPGSRYCWSVDGGVLLSTAGAGATVQWTGSSGSIAVVETNALAASGETQSLSVAITSDCCPAPNLLTPVFATSTTADLSWTPVAEADGYLLRGGPISGPAAGIEKQKNTTATSLRVPGLVPGVSYQWSVQSWCAGDTSNRSTGSFVQPGTKQAGSSDPAMDNPAMVAFPNPWTAREMLSISAADWPQGPLYVELYDAQGRRVFAGQAEARGRFVQIPPLTLSPTAGLYIVHIHSADGNWSRQLSLSLQP